MSQNTTTPEEEQEIRKELAKKELYLPWSVETLKSFHHPGFEQTWAQDAAEDTLTSEFAGYSQQIFIANAPDRITRLLNTIQKLRKQYEELAEVMQKHASTLRYILDTEN